MEQLGPSGRGGSTYPVVFAADYLARRSRLSVFFRLILLIPLWIVLFVYGVIAEIVVVISWFAIVVTARYPQALFDFMAGFTRYVTRITAFGALLCDRYPPLWGTPDPGYPIRLEFAGPLDPYSRAKTFFRLILAIPLIILRWAIGLLLELMSVVAWFVIVISGRMPRGMFDVMAWATSYVARSDTYLFLLTETYPPLQGETYPAVDGTDTHGGLPAAPPAAPAAPAPAEIPEPPPGVPRPEDPPL